MDYREAIDYIHSLGLYGSKLGLDNIRELLARLGDPQKKLRFVHVAGTNGKGSTSALIAGILRAAGYRTGLFVSPYLTDFTERIQVDGEPISKAELARHAGRARAAMNAMSAEGHAHPTEFEAVTAIGMEHFYKSGCDAVVLEVGLGGRLDATNAIDASMASVIATIDYDHMRQLGDTLEQIAREKAGIFKPNCEAVTRPQHAPVLAVFRAEAERAGARLTVSDFSSLRKTAGSLAGQEFDYKGFNGLRINLLGEFQLGNAALAIEAVEAVNRGFARGMHPISIPEPAIRKGLNDACWPGRFELVSASPPFIVDVAHNAQCARALRGALDEHYPGMKVAYVFGMLADKDFGAVADATMPMAGAVFTVTPDSPRALSAEAAAAAVLERAPWLEGNVRPCRTVEEAVDAAFEAAASNGMAACAFGSFYFTGRARARALKIRDALSQSNPIPPTAARL